MYKQDLNTSCGMWALWDYETYKEVTDYHKWEALFCEDKDIIKQIEKQSFIPICIHQDGCFSFTVKIDEDLSEREQNYICVKSEEFLLKSNGKVVLSGIECIETDVDETNTISIDLPEGFYSVTVYLISWEEEPGAILDNGEINPDALSDFVILVKSNADATGQYRQSINTFSEDD